MTTPLAPVAVTGMGGLCAAGWTIAACLDSLFRGERFPGPPTRFSGPFSTIYPVFEIEDGFWRPEDFTTRPGSRTIQMSLTATAEALEDAGLTHESLREKRIGVCIGSNVSGTVSNRDLADAGQAATHRHPTPAERFSAANPALGIDREFGVTGPVLTIVTACSAGGDAIGTAAAWIRLGLCDIVIAGGADELYEVTYNGFISLMNSDDRPCRPFDADRKGLNLGEGAAVMILESAESCRGRDKTPRGFVLGYGASSDAYHLTTPHPEGKGLVLAVGEALAAGGLSPGDIAFINAHGTGTPDNDRIESRLFHERFPGVPFLSTKGYTGHTLGAAGALEAAFTLGCLERGMIPPSAGFAVPDPELPASPASRIQAVSGRAALSQTLAFGGNNAVLVLGTGEAAA